VTGTAALTHGGAAPDVAARTPTEQDGDTGDSRDTYGCECSAHGIAGTIPTLGERRPVYNLPFR
jgi:hypothetical protein